MGFLRGDMRRGNLDVIQKVNDFWTSSKKWTIFESADMVSYAVPSGCHPKSARFLSVRTWSAMLCHLSPKTELLCRDLERNVSDMQMTRSP